MKKTCTYYESDRDFYVFTCWNKEHTSCGCHSVNEADLQANIEALSRMGYAVENLDKEAAQ